jgi:hypothetical protein
MQDRPTSGSADLSAGVHADEGAVVGFRRFDCVADRRGDDRRPVRYGPADTGGAMEVVVGCRSTNRWGKPELTRPGHSAGTRQLLLQSLSYFSSPPVSA